MLEITEKRKSIKKVKIEVELKHLDQMYCLVFTLPNPFYKMCIGATNLYSLEDADEIASKVANIFQNSTGKYTYCLVSDIIRELTKQEINKGVK